MKALVTGANGHLGTALTELLVSSGHQVRASIRGASDPVKSGPLRTLGVEVVEADVMDAAAMVRACEGMEIVFHLAAVFRFVVTDPQKDLIDPAVKGAENALRAAKKAGVRRVVLTSSNVAIGNKSKGDRPLDERDWNDGAVNHYARAKTLAERRAWELAAELGQDLVCINPTGILGPGFARHTPLTLVLANMYEGTMPLAPKFTTSYVDNRDVARAHLLAAENAAAKGRYLVSGEAVPMIELGRRMKALFPAAKPPTGEVPTFLNWSLSFFDWFMHKTKGVPRQTTADMVEEYEDPTVRFNPARAKTELGWSSRPFEETLKDTVDWIVAKRPANW
jgi:dihydroflavonol-4-reductase